MSQTRTLRGVIHGQTITLDCPVDFAEGEAVEVTIAPVDLDSTSQNGGDADEQLMQLPGFGSLADIPEEVDDFNRWYRELRQADPPVRDFDQ